MLRFQPPRELPQLDALLVLGRGIKLDGELTQTGFERAEIAAELAQTVFRDNTGLVVFSGGRSWRQAMSDVKPPSEGGSMLDYAIDYGGPPPSSIEYVAEEESESTIANMVNSWPLLDATLYGKSDARLGILSDDLHFAYGRVQHAAGLVFPGVDTIAIRIPRVMIAREIKEEKHVAFATKIFMAGVRPGDLAAITRRQTKLEQANNLGRRLVGGFRPLPGEIASPDEHETSFKDVPEFTNMSTPVMAGFLVGRM